MRQQAIFNEIESVLSKRFSGNVKIQNSNSLGGGCINHASKIETNVGAFFVKWNGNCAPDMFLREAESLQELKKAGGKYINIPEVFAAKKVDETPGFLVQEFFNTQYSSQPDEINLGRGLAQIHKYSNNKYGFLHDNYCGATPQNNSWTENWIEFFREKRLRYLISLIRKRQFLSSSDLNILDQLMDRLEILIPEDSEKSLIHGDLWSGNFMISDKGPVLIDPASYFAHREMEFGIITMFGGFSSNFYKGYNEIYPLENDWHERNKLYQLYHILNHYYLFGGGYGPQAIQLAKSYL